MDIANLFFKFSGRINRAKFWIATLVYAVIYLMLMAIGYATDQNAIVQSLNGMLGIVMLISSIAVGIKRLHDRNKSGWTMLLFYLAPGVLLAIGTMMGLSYDGSDTVAGILALAAAAIGIWAFVELGCLRGSIGGNAYGPDPIAPEVLTPPVRTH
jgi:uncharacterized membrane protein YhaH (DUF805 family)